MPHAAPAGGCVVEDVANQRGSRLLVPIARLFDWEQPGHYNEARFVVFGPDDVNRGGALFRRQCEDGLDSRLDFLRFSNWRPKRSMLTHSGASRLSESLFISSIFLASRINVNARVQMDLATSIALWSCFG